MAGAGALECTAMPEDSSRFYSGLKILTDFADVGSLENYAALPDDWHVAMCDVRNSTAAVEAGRYKNVNTVGAAAITAVEPVWKAITSTF